MIFTMGGGAPEGGLQTCQICIAVALAAGPDTGKPLVFQGVFMGWAFSKVKWQMLGSLYTMF